MTSEKMNYFYEDFFFKMGRIIVYYNLIESNVIGLICNLTDFNDIKVGFLKCKKKSASQLLKLLNDLVKKNIKDNDVLHKFNVLHNHIKDVIEIRNGYIHSIYIDSENKEMFIGEQTKYISQIKLREFEKGQTKINSGLMHSLEGMDNFINILLDVWSESNKFFGDISRVTPVRQIYYTFPEIPSFLKS